jgi:hypothetical protein
MNKLLTCMLVVMLSGCSLFTTKPSVERVEVIRYKYVVKTLPPQLLTIPARVPMIDVQTATDRDLANWIVVSEQRSLLLEQNIGSIKALYDKQLEYIRTLAPEDVIE